MTAADEEKMIEALEDIRAAIVSTGIMLHTDSRKNHRDQAYVKLIELARQIGVIPSEEPKVDPAETIELNKKLRSASDRRNYKSY